MKKLQIFAYTPWDSIPHNMSWFIEYTDSTLYKIIHEKRQDYPQHHMTFYYEDGQVTTMEPLNREEKYI